jgi:glutamate synthase domain-containing protein 2
MSEQTSGTTETSVNPMEDNPWAAAFAALEPKSEEIVETDANAGNSDVGGNGANADTVNGQDTSQAESGNSDANEDVVGGLDSSTGADDNEGESNSGNAFAEAVGITEESIQQFENDLNEDIRQQAINEVAAEFIKRGIRNRDGALGATLDDDDICKRDSDGVPHFYDPETGREFTDNPRAQAQAWVDAYNKELARVFNNTCQQYEEHLKEESAPRLAVMKFAPKYEKLDDIRKGMFDNVIEDYEIKDNDNKVIGYSCDLDKALALVERQITMIQNYAKNAAVSNEQKPQPTGPALDMKTSSGAMQTGNDAPPSSLAEAMERLQDVQLSKIQK